MNKLFLHFVALLALAEPSQPFASHCNLVLFMDEVCE